MRLWALAQATGSTTLCAALHPRLRSSPRLATHPRRRRRAAAATALGRSLTGMGSVLSVAGELGKPSDAADIGGDPGKYRVIKEETVYSRYIKVYDRVVEQPWGPSGHRQSVAYDVVSSRHPPHRFVAVFPYCSSRRSVTLIREYCQGADALVLSLPCGVYEPGRHGTLEDAAVAELSEEVKWCKNRFTPFLAIDPEVQCTSQHVGLTFSSTVPQTTPQQQMPALLRQDDEAPAARDGEEGGMEIVEVPLSELPALLYGGSMLLPSLATCTLALHRLEAMKLI
eukprot:jgi/Chlat1/8518/Chrsp80S00641